MWRPVSFNEPFFQSAVALVLITGATVAHFFARPYIESWFDIMESTALLNLCFLVISGMVFYIETRSEYIKGWEVSFFVFLATQMSLGVAIFFVDVYDARCNAKAVKGIESKLKAGCAVFDRRFEAYSRALQHVGLAHCDGVTLAQVSAAFEEVDDGLPANLKSVHAVRLFRQAQAVESLSFAGSSGPIRDLDLPDQTGTLWGDESMRDPASIAIDSILQSVAIEYIEMLMKGGMRELCRLFRHIDQDGNAALCISEVQPLWDKGIPEHVDPTLKMLALECFFLLAGDDRELQLEEIHSALKTFAEGESVVSRMLTSLESEAVSKLSRLVASTVEGLLGDGKASAGAGTLQEAPSARRSLPRSHVVDVAQAAARRLSDVTQKVLRQATAGSLEETVPSAESMGSVFESLIDVFKPAAIQDWVANDPEIGNFLVFCELGKSLKDMQTAGVHQIHPHGTTFESEFYTTIFDTLPFIMDWMLEADLLFTLDEGQVELSLEDHP
ncbi:hypothetical protein CYMTET_20782 [Cymbomonas tetramitiformis]|uniref:Uncharacterized protein n=1 Tax=Cymbomonas tetramitiformis TaxID=36881 RepID=A0AAE0G3H2_9CHLO|nr:hypothetical protein CYMTET_20782 [Cymbomonas tetramitiformis]